MFFRTHSWLLGFLFFLFNHLSWVLSVYKGNPHGSHVFFFSFLLFCKSFEKWYRIVVHICSASSCWVLNPPIFEYYFCLVRSWVYLMWWISGGVCRKSVMGMRFWWWSISSESFTCWYIRIIGVCCSSMGSVVFGVFDQDRWRCSSKVLKLWYNLSYPYHTRQYGFLLLLSVPLASACELVLCRHLRLNNTSPIPFDCIH